MGTYKGNSGHLMQHWPLCEVLGVAKKRGVIELNYIDAHAMAPLAEPQNAAKIVDIFARVQRNLPGQNSSYEKAWHDVPRSEPDHYPSSAVFIKEVWKGKCSLLLCEKDTKTAEEIKRRLPEAEVFPGDWRDKFEDGLPSPSASDPSISSLTLVSFDPYKYISTQKCPRRKRDGNVRKDDLGKLFPDDLQLTLRALEHKGPVIIQLSTYGATPSTQREVIASVDAVLRCGKFERAAKVRPITVKGKPSKSMMSLLYAHNVSWADELNRLSKQFETWMRQIRRVGH